MVSEKHSKFHGHYNTRNAVVVVVATDASGSPENLRFNLNWIGLFYSLLILNPLYCLMRVSESLCRASWIGTMGICRWISRWVLFLWRQHSNTTTMTPRTMERTTTAAATSGEYLNHALMDLCISFESWVIAAVTLNFVRFITLWMAVIDERIYHGWWSVIWGARGKLIELKLIHQQLMQVDAVCAFMSVQNGWEATIGFIEMWTRNLF